MQGHRVGERQVAPVALVLGRLPGTAEARLELLRAGSRPEELDEARARLAGVDARIAQIEQQIADYARRAQERKLELSELTGAVFTISNGGIFGSMLSTPIINPPGSAILGMHAIKKRPVVVDDEIVIRPMMYLALSYDHRLIDGREAVTFLKRIVDVIENPERVLLEI